MEIPSFILASWWRHSGKLHCVQYPFHFLNYAPTKTAVFPLVSEKRCNYDLKYTIMLAIEQRCKLFPCRVQKLIFLTEFYLVGSNTFCLGPHSVCSTTRQCKKSWYFLKSESHYRYLSRPRYPLERQFCKILVIISKFLTFLSSTGKC